MQRGYDFFSLGRVNLLSCHYRGAISISKCLFLYSIEDLHFIRRYIQIDKRPVIAAARHRYIFKEDDALLATVGKIGTTDVALFSLAIQQDKFPGIARDFRAIVASRTSAYGTNCRVHFSDLLHDNIR